MSVSTLLQNNLGDFEGTEPFENEKNTRSNGDELSPEAKAYPESVIYVTKKGYKYTSGRRLGSKLLM